MKRRIILQGTDARDALTSGAKKLADAVGSTLGPFGQNWFLDKKDTVTNDGVTIAREYQLLDEVENRGVKAIREAAIKTNDQAGDGTTTSIVLANAIYQNAKRYLGKKTTIGQKSPSQVIKQISQEKDEVLTKLADMAKPIESEEELIKSAIVSTEDEELGTLIGKAQWELGPDGILVAEDSNDKSSSIEHVKGIRIDNGFGSSGVVNNQEKWAMEVENTHILLTSHTIKTIGDWNELLKMFQQAAKGGITQVVVIARAWTDETIMLCLQQLNQSGFKVYPLNAPYENMTERFKDLAAVTGATFYDSESSELSDIMVSGLGRADKVIRRRMESFVIGHETEYTKEATDKRVEELNTQFEGSESEFEKKRLKERIAQLTNGFAIVKVGSSSDMEKRRVLDKAEDAVNAVRAALQEGTVPGAGLAYKQIADGMPDDAILKRPLMAPYEQIMSSAPEGFVIEDWVRDPHKVMRLALENACAAAAAFATAEGVITEKFPDELGELFKTNAPQQ